jgi:NitT/TauT family transport system permease protein
MTGDYMLTAFWITTKEVICGFALALFLNFSLGILVGETRFGERTIMPYLVTLETMP